MPSIEKFNVAIVAKDLASKTFKSFTKEIQKAKKEAGGMSGKLKELGGNMRDTGKQLTASLTLPIVGFGAAAIKFASDAQEVQSKFDVVFRGMEGTANEWAESFGNSVGRATTTIQEFSGGLSDILKPLGFATEEAFEMSQQMTQLALDVASFNNKSDAQVINAFTSALTGERDSLKSLGIVMSEADVKAEILRLSQQGLTFESEKVAKATATMNLLFANTVDAQGDLARTSDSAANQMKRFKENGKELAVEFGENLLPALVVLLEKLNSLFDWFGSLSETTQNFILVTAGLLAVIGPVITIVGVLTTAVGALGTALMFVAASPVVLIIAAIAAVGAAIYLLITDTENIKVFWLDVWDTMKQKLDDVWPSIKEFFINMGLEILGMMTPINSVIGAFESMMSLFGKSKAQVATFKTGGSAFKNKALGGKVSAGSAVTVGELGREVFVPSQNGSIIPHNKLGGGGGTTINLNFNGIVSSREVAEEYADMMVGRLKLATKVV
jgi:hypothetical protein